ncbi:type II toxin-antitoxin system Phd/YefM family antitoxin [Starkeya sp. ORNL1]|uniref:type II toxin-antitoxin system prevent-host-death family antitoxin n=1 Tax=Starkeya sp. ORNL1 TaxID=2709380 RepID=UPI0014637478|nr:type II toxin-antitoxin system prevent-host-death family antitoxin [Starkeya sp. ORNL1]QJP15976.1 type II toxin-antitoxin system Phd/YefM family antitoxin [Starkeya sp. ORNL1]
MSVDVFAENVDGLVDGLTGDERPTLITADGKPRAVLLDIARYEELRETLALVRIVAIGEQEVRDGKFLPLEEAFRSIRRHTPD